MKHKHRLKINCLHDAQAECKCGHWNLVCTGERTKEDIRQEYQLHLKYSKKYGR
jgi:hypothetical protein